MRYKIIVFLLFGLIFNLSRAQSEGELSEQFELASAQLSQTEAISPVISMDFQNADLKNILKVFSQQAGLNFIASENVKERKITLYLDNVPVEDALNTIMNANNLTYEQEKDSKIFVVREWGKPEVETITKIFPLQYARVKGYELGDDDEDDDDDDDEETNIQDVLEDIKSEHGKVIGDSRTNSLVITDMPSQFPKIEETIKGLDIKLPQVMIEVEVIEAKLDTIDKLGIKWGGATDGELASAFGAARIATFPFTKPQEMSKVGPDGNPINLYTGYVSAMKLGGVLAMLAKDTDTKILARPRILTLNNETAEIKIVADEIIGEVVTYNEAGTPTTKTPQRTSELNLTSEGAGVSLRVTPQINSKTGEITMFIYPQVSEAVASTLFPTLGGDANIRSTKSVVRVRDGETVILGGLIHTKDSKSLRKVPFLGDIPLLGNLFRKKDDSSMDKEVIIFITPHLIKEGAKHAGLVLERQTPREYETSGLKKEEAMERILDRLER